MSRWGKFQDVADLPVRAFNESKYSRTYEGGGGGGGQNTTTQVSLSPEQLEDYRKAMDETWMEFLKPYSSYSGPTIAGFAPEQTTAMQGIYGLQTPGALGAAETGMANLAAAGAPTYTAGTFDAAAAAQYMDPYMRQVLDTQKAEARKEFARGKAGRAAQAVQAGAFGGGRAGAEEAVAESEMLDRMAQIEATGMQTAYQQAREQFGAEQAMQQQQAQIGQQAQQMQLQVAQAQEQLGNTQQAMEVARLNLQKATGAEEQALAQRQYDRAEQDFLNARDYNRNQLAFLNAMMRGMPTQSTSQTVQTASTAGLGTQLAGAGIAGLGSFANMG
jgi:hypothetical protein